MFILFVVLAVLSLLALIGGSALALIRYGKTTRRSGPEVGAEMLRDDLTGDDTGVAGGAVFVGKGVAVEREVSVPVGDLKAAWRAGKRREVLPFLAAMAGLDGIMVFTGLALLFRLEDKLAGAILLGMGLYAIWIMLNDLRKA